MGTFDETLEHQIEVERLMEEIRKLKESKWISVKDRLPEKSDHGKSFLVYEPLWGVDIRQWQVKGTFEGFYWRQDKEVATHWQPLPEPPKEKLNG